MVCEKCEKKLGKVIVPDKWKEGASNTTEGGGRKINENKLLSKKNRSPSGFCWNDWTIIAIIMSTYHLIRLLKIPPGASPIYLTIMRLHVFLLQKEMFSGIFPTTFSTGTKRNVDYQGHQLWTNDTDVSLNMHDSFFHTKNGSDSEIDCFVDGPLMELPSASSASSKYTKMASTVTLVLTLKAYVQCAVSKCWTPSFTNKAMYDMEKITFFYFSLVLLLGKCFCRIFGLHANVEELIIGINTSNHFVMYLNGDSIFL
ncbi:hypothetical protein RHMOL_Rhmol02G0122100 [Rhododendron molle]|uniref:Uncharacterized protein n=1 Tax=Rhododendron molle TaxID=49168 RepID=A0ACC0PQK8_RHOML|nr:hypothetical protein RHMOL_Rhmol02G0122100 [Rhododendron molle]